MEQISNNAITTLAAPCAPGDLALTLSNAAAFPAGPTFRIVVGSGDMSDAEIMTVTAVAGNSFTVSRATEPTAGVQTAFAHPAGSIVAQAITSTGLWSKINDRFSSSSW